MSSNSSSLKGCEVLSHHCIHEQSIWIKHHIRSPGKCLNVWKSDSWLTFSNPLRPQWEKLQMTASERRKILCSVTFHIIAITCVVWSLYVLIDRTADEIKRGRQQPPRRHRDTHTHTPCAVILHVGCSVKCLPFICKSACVTRSCTCL